MLQSNHSRPQQEECHHQICASLDPLLGQSPTEEKERIFSLLHRFHLEASQIRAELFIVLVIKIYIQNRDGKKMMYF